MSEEENPEGEENYLRFGELIRNTQYLTDVNLTKNEKDKTFIDFRIGELLGNKRRKSFSDKNSSKYCKDLRTSTIIIQKGKIKEFEFRLPPIKEEKEILKRNIEEELEKTSINMKVVSLKLVEEGDSIYTPHINILMWWRSQNK